ncbi:sigma-70 family RNA polymerase sigma factor [Cohnella panacarvi]|uniref:sigma-70 family RNA polymerase sigma factor n=1 Tax=Cohnella panacarvi TaxID=400776 RepID=UPI001FE0D170|nr:sigma-70 family RNA polymerase sigma factor [Cohnella panacarvi]
MPEAEAVWRPNEAAEFGADELADCMAEHGDAVLRTAYVYLRDRQKAEDAYQEVFIRVYRNGGRLRRMEKLRPWILKVTINVCRDLKRSAWWRKVLFRHDRAEDTAVSEAEAVASAEHQAIASEQSREVLEQVMRLEERYRMVVLMFYYHEWSTQEIADALQVREGTVRSRLHRGRALLKGYIEKSGGEWT